MHFRIERLRRVNTFLQTNTPEDQLQTTEYSVGIVKYLSSVQIRFYGCFGFCIFPGTRLFGLHNPDYAPVAAFLLGFLYEIQSILIN